jgi:biopolymer transport protein ExbD
MKKLIQLTILGALLAMSSACAQSQAPTPSSVVKISVLASGKLLLNGQPSDLAQIEAEFQRQKTRGGSVWYYRENGQSEPPAEAMSVIELVTKHGLPVSMSTSPDFSDYVDGNGQVHAREP